MIKPIKTIRKTTTLSRTARVLSYYYNALIDAELSYALVQILKQKALTTSDEIASFNEVFSLKEVQVRAQTYAQLSNLAGLAYNLYYANGLANWLYAQLFRPFLTVEGRSLVDRYLMEMKRQLTTPFIFQEVIRKHYTLSYWPTLVVRQKTWVKQFLKTRGLAEMEIKLNDDVLKKTAHTVQKYNSQFNQQVAEWLLAGDGPDYQKLTLLRAAAQESKREKRFIKTCARVQRAAARWDGLYRRLVRE